jgi:hypothetical protein
MTPLTIAGILVTFPFAVMTVYLYVTRTERFRIDRLKNVFSQYNEGPINEGGELLLWEPINWRPTVTAACLLAIVAAVLLLWSNESIGLELLLLMIANLIIVGISIAYHFIYYLKYTGNTVIIVDSIGIQEVHAKKEGIELGQSMKWAEVKDVDTCVSGGGDSLGAENSGIGLVTPSGRIGIGKSNVNSSLFYYLFLHEFAKDRLTFHVREHLSSLGRLTSQQYLNE